VFILDTAKLTPKITGCAKTFFSGANLLANTLDKNSVSALTGNATDRKSPIYTRLKGQLEEIRRTIPEVRFIYLMEELPDGRIVFLVDSEPVDSEEHSAPGDVYEDFTAEEIQAFAQRKEVISGPVEDDWGSWVTALSPVDISPPSGTKSSLEPDRLIVLGVDVEASEWENELSGQLCRHT
jgi:hypothetical protein